MDFHPIAAVLAGIIGTGVMTGMMLLGKRLNLPAVDAHGILGYLRFADRASSIGYILHFVLGAALAVGYALVFTVIDEQILGWGAFLGILHWLAVGWMFSLAPLAHAGMKAGVIQPTGPYMLRSLGISGFIAGLIGHIAFGLVVAWVYSVLSLNVIPAIR